MEVKEADIFVVGIQGLGTASLPLVGGKAANLGELTAAGLPVPAAFCVTTAAYREFIAANSLADVILGELTGLDYSAIGDLVARAERIRSRIVAGIVPPAIEAAIRGAYAELASARGNDVPVSVRSSATAEDLPGMSFAGQQDTYLHIQGTDAVLDHIRQCWASLWTDRAISYRHRQGFRHDEVLLAVVVQEMFPSEISGVMFTANPVTSNPDEIFVNASWGLGEAVVSGRVNPDQFILDKRDGQVRERTINDKEVMTVRRTDGQGSEEGAVPTALRTRATLDDALLAELAAIGRRIETHYGFPQDIEWGYADGRFAVLQAREITAANLDFSHELEATFQTPGALASLTDERWIWSRAYSDEVQTGPSTPFFYSMLQESMTGLKHRLLDYTGTTDFLGYDAAQFGDIPMYRWYGARAYYNLAVERERILRFIPPFARDDAALWPFPEEQRAGIRKALFNWPRFLWTLLKLQVTNPRISLTDTPQRVFDNMVAWNEETARIWAEIDLERASVAEIFATERRARSEEFRENVVLPFSIYLFTLPAALRELCVAWLDDRDGRIYGDLVSGLSTKTGEENVAIWQLAEEAGRVTAVTDLINADAPVRDTLERIRRLPEAAAFIARLDAFIRDYGHRGGAERDPIHPRFRHQPENVLVPIRAMLRLDPADSPPAIEHRLAERMKATRARCIETLRSGPIGFLRAPVFAWFLELVQRYVYYRDYERFYNDRNMSRPRDYLDAIGRKFVKRGMVDDPEDVYFLGRGEIIDADAGKISVRDVQHRIRARRRVYARYAQTEPPKYIAGWRTFDDALPIDDGRGLKGIGASNGIVTGRARVCRKLDQIGKVEKGDILITVATDPGWTTVFSMIGGVVVETGGVVAHAVMISREYGLPCVANLAKACDLIPDGALITVDGGAGRVIVHEETAQ